jgi:hypothetical protein
MEIKINLTTNEQKDLKSYCKLNELDETEIVKKSYLEGFTIEKYGLLGGTGGVQEKEVIKEVVVEKRVEIPVEVIKEVVKVEYVEVPVEKVVTKIEYICDNTQENELLLKIQQLESERQEMGNIFQNKMSKKEQEIDELRQTLDEHLDRPPLEKIVEVVVEKEIMDNSLKSKLDALQTTLAKVRQETLEKDKKIRELEQIILDIQRLQENKQAVYLKGSNLDDKLYK